MNKRTQALRLVATGLWFVTGWSAAGVVVALAGLPVAVGTVAGLAVAMFVWFDPFSLFWTKPAAERRVRPIEEVAAELEQRGAGSPAEVRERA